MIKLRILNLKNFMETLEQCQGVVRMQDRDGGRAVSNRQPGIRADLERRYQEGGCLPLTLEFSDPSDYMRMVAYYAGDCRVRRFEL